MPLKYPYPQPYIVRKGFAGTIPVDFEDVRTVENAALKKRMVDYWLKKPLLGFYLLIAIKGDAVANAIHELPMVNYITDKQKTVQAEWGKVDIPYGVYDVYTTVKPQGLPNDRIILRRDVMQVV